MRKSSAALFLAAFIAIPTQSRADFITVFDATGDFSDGSTLAGTVTIDATTGMAIAASLTVTGPTSFTVQGIVSQSYSSSPFGYDDIVVGSEAFRFIELVIPSSLINYSLGGPLDSVASPSPYDSLPSYWDQEVAPITPLTSGSLTPTPELSTMTIWGLGIVGMAAWSWPP